MAPFSASTERTTPAIPALTWFMSFMTSTMQTVSSGSTVWPTSTKCGAPGWGDRQNNPTEGAVMCSPPAAASAGPAAEAGGTVGGGSAAAAGGAGSAGGGASE